MLDVEPLEIADVLLIKPKRHQDARGYFAETYNAEQFRQAGITASFVQDNQSFSVHPATVRGLHFQTPPASQCKLVRVLRGAIFDVAVDLRRDSPSYGRWCGVTLDDQTVSELLVPHGFAHGFYTLVPDTVVMYKVDHLYSAPHDGGLKWDDPDIGIRWPDAGTPTLSAKDSALPAFRDFVSPFA